LHFCLSFLEPDLHFGNISTFHIHFFTRISGSTRTATLLVQAPGQNSQQTSSGILCPPSPPRKERWEEHDELEGMKGRVCIKLLPQLVWLIAMAPNLADGEFGVSRIASVSEVREVMCSEAAAAAAAATLLHPIGGILRGGGDRRGGARVKRRIACVSSAPASRPLTCMLVSFL
jgi:hypothetical protein